MHQFALKSGSEQFLSSSVLPIPQEKSLSIDRSIELIQINQSLSQLRAIPLLLTQFLNIVQLFKTLKGIPSK
jgi:hypothetical protein